MISHTLGKALNKTTHSFVMNSSSVIVPLKYGAVYTDKIEECFGVVMAPFSSSKWSKSNARNSSLIMIKARITESSVIKIYYNTVKLKLFGFVISAFSDFTGKTIFCTAFFVTVIALYL